MCWPGARFSKIQSPTEQPAIKLGFSHRTNSNTLGYFWIVPIRSGSYLTNAYCCLAMLSSPPSKLKLFT